MKKFFAPALAIVTICALLLSACGRVTYGNRITKGTVTFYGATSVLTQEEAERIFELYDGKLMVKDDPSCGFSEDVSVSINDGQHVFYIAMDGCPIVYYVNYDRYVLMSDSEQETLYSILEKYGFHFPCV